MVSLLFLDIKGAFPSVEVKRLIHNMRMKGIPQEYTNCILNRLQGRKTRIHCNDFISDLLDIDNRCDQGNPTSVILYHFYNTGLIEIAKENNEELAPAFIDDVTFLAGGKTFEITHAKIHSMMTRLNGAYEWSRKHNSFFETDKLQLIDCSNKREKDSTKKGKTCPIVRSPLDLINGMIMPSSMHKLLGLILDQELCFSQHAAHMIAKGTKGIMQIQ